MKPATNSDASRSARERNAAGEAFPLISLENVRLGYGSAPVLEGVDLALYPGNLVGLAGPNGSGKTTLFRTILGLLPTLGGTLSRNCPLANFGYVPQSAALDPQFPLSVGEIVEMGAYGRVRSYQLFPSYEKKRAQRVLDQVGIGHVKEKSFFALSGGQKQRILIARAPMV
ncbi:MAG: metal ABC transporter ATP-binding protein, partial [Candidatus Angelobacter sp.]